MVLSKKNMTFVNPKNTFIMNIIRFIKNWTLPISMLCGIIGYFIYSAIPLSGSARTAAGHLVAVLQPLLIFAMLFLTFCKVDMHDLKLCKWHGWLLLFQTLLFTLLAVFLILIPNNPLRLTTEGAMICLICPTATAGAVVTRKLGGSAAHLTTYTILINLAVAVLIPTLVPLVHPNPDLSFGAAFSLIIAKVFPLLLLPLVAAFLVRILLPRLHAILVSVQDLSFYLWAVALALAIAVTVKSIMHSEVGLMDQAGLAVVSLVCCLLQFYFGRKIGKRYGDAISAGQSLGQKNTVLAIWMGYTFFTPVTSIAGGFYSIWHNVINSYQLYKMRQKQEKAESHETP